MTTPALQAADAAPEVPTSLADTLRSAFPADSLLLVAGELRSVDRFADVD